MNIPFSGGQNPLYGYGDAWLIQFGGTWAFDDSWQILVTSSEGDITFGFGDLYVDENNVNLPRLSSCFAYHERVYIANGPQFNFCDNNDATGWEEQNPGAGFISYISNWGAQDGVVGFGVLQGRLVVIGRRSIQIWNVDADPTNFSLQQVLDNIGTAAPASIQQIGDLDVFFLDDTGVRSTKAREVTLNAYVDDIGTPIDALIQKELSDNGLSAFQAACSVVDVKTKNYWLFLYDTIFVLSKYPTSGVAAWSTYTPLGDDNHLFVPVKFTTFQGTVYTRGTLTPGADYLYVYGGSNNSTYDPHSQVTWVTPYLDDKRPGQNKVWQALMAAMAGNWTLSAATDPISNAFIQFYSGGSTATPLDTTDSTYDIGRIQMDLWGTHIALMGVSNNQSTSLPAKFSAEQLLYNFAETA